MKKAKYIVVAVVIVALFIITFIWSQNMNLTFTSQILPRKTRNFPLEGSWVVEKYGYMEQSEVQEKEAKELIGKSVYFNEDAVHFNGETCEKPRYKVKSVDAKSYFWDVSKVSAKTVGISEKEVQIITIYSNEKYFDEYVRIDEFNLIKNYGGILLYFHKNGESSKEFAIDPTKEQDRKILISKAEREIKSKSGLLLGLKYKDKKVQQSNSADLYKTLWISSVEGKILPIEQTTDLLLPRQNGFWKVGVESKIENGRLKDKLWAYPLNPLKPDTKGVGYARVEDYISIQFAGSDYISVDTINNGDHIDKEGSSLERKLQVLPIDNLLGEGVKLSKVLGGELENMTLPSTLLPDSEDKKVAKAKNVESNWSVMRRSGRWILRGRVANLKNKEDNTINFDISYATPKALTTYDDLFPGFNVIKGKVPTAVDAYTSPNRDFIVVLTSEEILVFPLKGDKIGESVVTLPLKAGEVSVMAHWATGNYVDEWARKVK